MPKSVEICQLVARAISHTTWNIPRIRDGDRWRNIDNPHLVENPNCHKEAHEYIKKQTIIIKLLNDIPLTIKECEFLEKHCCSSLIG